ncbi:MAG: TAT-variant-translocated molybdopterin oxidoreductase [Pyrinomonadaceae bacterium]
MSTTQSSNPNLVQIQSRQGRIDEYHRLRDKVAAASQKSGRQYWRSLEELADTEEFKSYVYNEFPEQAAEWNDPVGRRRFLKLMGASLALAGVSACAYQPRELIVPYVEQPEEEVPGKPLFFATATPLGGFGLLVKTNEGRPTKIEGNPLHPASMGATDVFAQASILNLYDPDRSQNVLDRGDIASWSSFLGTARTALEGQRGNGGAGFRILTETVTSPTLAAQLQGLLREFPAARWIQYDAANRDSANLGALQALGAPVNTVYRFDQARVVLAVDSDFLQCGAGNLRYARDFITGRRLEGDTREMNRLYAIESTPTNTGAKADHRLAMRPSEVEAFMRTLASQLGAGGAAGGGATYTGHAEWIAALARDLQANRGRSVVVVGNESSPTVHALGHAVNAALGNVPNTIYYTDPIEAVVVNQTVMIGELVRDMNAGAVDVLLIVGGNPVYTAPADLNFGDALQRLSEGQNKLTAHLSSYFDETSLLCRWHVPESHYLEAWSDARAFDGTAAIIQPLIEPLYGTTKSAHEFIGAFGEQPAVNGYDIVREFWGAQTQVASGGDFEAAWRRILHDGVIPNTAFQPRSVGVSGNSTGEQQSGQQANGTTPPPVPPATNTNAAPGGYEIVFRTDPSVYDGRFANNGWLQELPKPITKLTWDNAVLMSPATARKLEVETKVEWRGGNVSSDVVEVKFQGRTVQGAVWIVPIHADDVITVHLGYGRTRAGRVGSSTDDSKVGFNAYAIRPSNAMWSGAGVEIRKTGERVELAATQIHNLTMDREPVRVGTLAAYLESGDKHLFVGHHDEPPDGMSMFPPNEEVWPVREDIPQWGMTIDLNNCVGCNSCVVACQSENNIPVIGKEQVMRGREMHWLRIDAYYSGDAHDQHSAAGPFFQPLMCVHCEKAPCEPVCPVEATVHDTEGLNVQIYNRCIGTRYCSNNCPYKVRRFNFLLYQDWDTPQTKLVRNPDVSVRSRGVMEKCTYCVQRIQWAKIEASKLRRPIADGEVVTACQSACPTEAIVFGNIKDPEARVTKLRNGRRAYPLLGELNTRPRTTYLGTLRNPNPEIEPPVGNTTEKREGIHHE